MNNLIWFRNDLRVADNRTLIAACKGKNVIGVYFFDPKYFKEDRFGFKRTQNYRAKFLIETVKELKSNLNKLNIPLLIYHDSPENIIPSLVEEYQIQTIFLQKEWTRDEKEVLSSVDANLKSKVKFEEAFDQFLFHPDDLPYDDLNAIPQVFTNFRKKCEKHTSVRPCFEKPKPLSLKNIVPNQTKIPTLNDLGLDDFSTDFRTAFPYKGGEDEASQRLQYYFWETEKLATYKKTRNGLIGKDYSSKLSAWLANGSISARTVYWEVRKFEQQVKKNQDTYWLVFELLWRDYFKYVSLKHGNSIFSLGGILAKTYDWNYSEEKRTEWISGNTPEPFVNANMRELALTGWMSNRGRQNVASYWAKTLEQDWRVGAAYFESMLIDYDVHSNWGNWMYNSGVGNDPRDRVFNIQKQAERYDPKGNFQNLWLQETLF